MKIKSVSLLIATLFISTPLLAADKSWSGLKIGIGGGGSSSQAKTTNSASHNFGHNSSYATDNDPDSDDAVTNNDNPFGTNNKFDPTSTGDSNSYVETGSRGVIHGGFDNNLVQYYNVTDNRTQPTGWKEGTNYYNRNYQISEGFLGEAFDKLDLGKAAGFGTIDVTYDWQLNDSFVFGLTASANFSANQNANGAASGSNQSGWSEELSYNVINNTEGSGCDGDCSTGIGGGTPYTTYSSADSQGSDGFTANHGQYASTGMRSSFETQNSFDIGARIGFLPTNNTLVYATGGFSTIKVKQKTSYRSAASFGEQESIYGDQSTGDIFDSNSYSFETSKSDSEYKPGYFLGAGIETRMTDTVSLKLEYRYADYGTINSRASSNNASIQDGVSGNEFEFYKSLGGSYNLSQKTDLTTQSIRAVLSYNF
jgi:opacity protein-like surface antigen